MATVSSGYYYLPQRSCGQGNIFTPVCHSFCSQRGSASVHAGIPPPGSRPSWSRPPRADIPQEQTALGADPPWEQTPPGSRPPWEQTPQEQTPPWEQTPLEQTLPPPGADTPREADSSIRSTSGRYASYSNAFLFQVFLLSTFAHVVGVKKMTIDQWCMRVLACWTKRLLFCVGSCVEQRDTEQPSLIDSPSESQFQR